MTTLYTKGSIVCKLLEEFSKIFLEQSKPTQRHLYDLILSVLSLNGYHSIKFNFEHFIGKISQFKLKSYYFTLNKSKIDMNSWLKRLIRLALEVVPHQLRNQPIVLSIDDTMVEKFGKSFENCSKLFDHASHNGSNYLNGHCFVSLLVSLPVCDRSGKHYLSLPLGYRMWTKEQTKLDMAAELVKTVMEFIDPDRRVVLCCDSWYPKGAIKDLIHEYENLTLICNVRSDTALYEIPSPDAGGRGRPRIKGAKLSLEQFQLKKVPNTDFCVGAKAVKTKLFGNRVVYAIVTRPKKGSSLRLFFSTTNPEALDFDLDFSSNPTALAYAQADSAFLPLTIYALRWNIEVCYYEQKSFWSLEKYMLQSKVGIERLINLLSLIYAFMLLLPYLDDNFSALAGLRPQQARFLIGNCIQEQLFFSTFVEQLQADKIPPDLLNLLQSHVGGLSCVA